MTHGSSAVCATNRSKPATGDQKTASNEWFAHIICLFTNSAFWQTLRQSGRRVQRLLKKRAIGATKAQATHQNVVAARARIRHSRSALDAARGAQRMKQRIGGGIVLAAMIVGAGARAASPLQITTTTCPAGVQDKAYAGCQLVATGGTPPYRFSADASDNYPPLPEGILLTPSTGQISSTQIGGQGAYFPRLIVTDHSGATASRQIKFSISGANQVLATAVPNEFDLSSSRRRRDDRLAGRRLARGADLLRLSLLDDKAVLRQ